MTKEDKKLSDRRNSVRRPTQTVYCQKLDCVDYISVTDSVGLVALNLIQMTPKAAVLREIMHNDGQGDQYWQWCKAQMRLPISE